MAWVGTNADLGGFTPKIRLGIRSTMYYVSDQYTELSSLMGIKKKKKVKHKTRALKFAINNNKCLYYRGELYKNNISTLVITACKSC